MCAHNTHRDRAEERRRGINPDYASANQLAAALPGDVDMNALSVEETKYLGGDIEHTHLVKGLDFALLQKRDDVGLLQDRQGDAPGRHGHQEARQRKVETEGEYRG
eukprot:27457-Chlamydomonas_euryale.AAC.1